MLLLHSSMPVLASKHTQDERVTVRKPTPLAAQDLAVQPKHIRGMSCMYQCTTVPPLRAPLGPPCERSLVLLPVLGGQSPTHLFRGWCSLTKLGVRHFSSPFPLNQIYLITHTKLTNLSPPQELDFWCYRKNLCQRLTHSLYPS